MKISKKLFVGGQNKMYRQKHKRLLSGIMCIALALSAFSGVLLLSNEEVNAQSIFLSNPRIVADDAMKAGQKVTWDCIWFGSYPQAEVVPASQEYTALDHELLQDCELLQDGDLIKDDALYNTLQNATGWDKQGDVVVAGEKYRRIKEEDVTHSSTSLGYYQWDNVTDYHYFKYQPIKWRVLSVSGSEVMLLADRALDDKQYNTSRTNVTWEDCTMRSWLNGYDGTSNVENRDYSNNNFIDTAFSISEQSVIIDTQVENEDNLSCGTEGGNDTEDKIFLLSESEVYTDAAKTLGFLSNDRTYDEARRAKSSLFAKAMGTWSNTVEEYAGICVWWLRSPGYYSSTKSSVSIIGWVDGYEADVDSSICSVRPALYFSLKASSDAISSNLYSYAGTVCSDGTVDEVGEDEKATSSPSATPDTILSPSSVPSSDPLNTLEPTSIPADKPTQSPTVAPSSTPVVTSEPSVPTKEPTTTPETILPPSSVPSSGPSNTPEPTSKPVVVPSYAPIVPPSVTATPTVLPDPGSTQAPSATVTPTSVPADKPTQSPTVAPSSTPVVTSQPSVPTKEPTATPENTLTPSVKPSSAPDTDNDSSTSSANKLKKGTKVTDKKTTAVYKVTATGSNKAVEYVNSTKKNVTSVTIPATVKLQGKTYKVTSIGKSAFQDSKKLKMVKIGKNIKTIGNQAFSGCKKLTKVTIGNNVTTIGANAFSKCSALTIITIPSKVQKIGTKAFYQCKKLQYFLVKTNKLTLENIGKNAFGGGYGSPRVKTDKSIWERYSNVFILRGMSNKATFVIDPVKLVI